MRRLIVVAVAAASLATASLLASGRAEAMPGTSGLGVAGRSDLAQDIRTVCRPVWNGWRWIESCYWVPGPSYYGPPRHHHRRHHHHHRRW